MRKIKNYIILEQLNETRSTIVYRGRKETSKDTVIIKALKTKDPTPSEIARFRQEYKLISSLDIEGIIKVLDLQEHTDGLALVLEDFDGISIKRLLEDKKKLDQKLFLSMAIKIADALGSLHENGIVHRDVKPHNILINPKTGMIKITDFGISSEITHENDEIYNPDVIEGSLVYMSPEQTGRMNRTVDYRTDIYSLGVTLYEIITGFLPFKPDDPMAIIHSHIALKPVSPRHHDMEIPKVISDIILKLLSKNMEDRYQNAFGLRADLEECLKQLTENGKIESFKPGMNDISNRFIIPQILVGREEEIEILISSFEKLCNISESCIVTGDHSGVEMMLVAGEPGIGKSALIYEIHKPIVERRGYFISGKYEQFRGEKPYSAIILAFQGLVRQILAESNESIRTWKEKLLDTLGPNGRVITDIIPEIELIIGEQPELAELDPEETGNRFRFVFERFASVFSTARHPVVLFLDDLQWADIPGMQLIKNMTTSPDINYLYLIGSYRDNEMDKTHPLLDMINDIKKAGVKINRINLGPILEGDIKKLIINFLKCTDKYGTLLASLVHKKTGGNPFFIIQFLKTLYTENLIEFDAGLGWIWDIERINQLQVTDNVVDLLEGKINRLPGKIREVVKICAVIGNRIDLETLSFVQGYTIDEVLDNLTSVIDMGLVNLSSEKEFYIFHHDRIQEAAYSLVSDDERAALHYRIGKMALEKASSEDVLEKRLFYIADQLNLGSKLITGAKEREDLARLNLDAGIRAKASSAFSPAIRYLEEGIGLLEDDCWEKQYDLILSLYSEITEAVFLNGDYDKMNELSEVALQHTKTALDKVKIILSSVYARTSQEDFQGSVDVGLPMLKLLGVRFPKKPSKLRVGIELLKLKIALLGKTHEDLLNLPKMTDPQALESMQVLAGMGHSAFFVNPNLFALDVIKPCRLAIKYGNGPDNGFGFAGYGVLLAAGLWDFDGAAEFGNLALKLVVKLGARKQLSRTLFVYYGIIQHWRMPLADTIPHFFEGYSIGMETGDLDYASFNLLLSDLHSFLSGKELSEYNNNLSKHNQIIKDFNKKYILTIHSLFWQGALNLLGQCDDPLMLSGKAIEGEKTVGTWVSEKNNAALTIFYFTRLFVRVVYNEYSRALEDSKIFKNYSYAMQGVVVNQFAVLFDSISRIVLYRDASFFKKIKYRMLIKVNQWKMKRWANAGPMNCRPMFQLVEALRAWQIHKDINIAKKRFERTIRISKRPDNIITEAIATELLATLYMSLGDEEKTKEYMGAAYNAFSSWGALGKLKQLEEKYPEFLEDQVRAKTRNATTANTETGTATTISETLDFSTAMKASQAISGEIVLEKLLVKMIEITIENAGADKGFVILDENGMLCVEAEKTIGSDVVTVLKSIPVDTHEGLSLNIVNYAARTKETLILNDAANEGSFTNDSYIAKNKPKSILCIPILLRKKLLGILYLENNLSTGAFTTERLEILKVISSQIAISIDNAKVYENLEDKVRERTEELHSAFEELEAMVETLADTNDQLESTNDELESTNDELETTNERLIVTNKELERAHQVAQIDMNMAINVQTSLFLKTPPTTPDWDVAFTFKPMAGVSGDLYYFYEENNELKGLTLLDVSGHGIASGLITMIARSVFDRNFKSGKNEKLNHIMDKTNKDLINEISDVGNYLTGILLRFKGNSVEYVNGGHCDLLCKRAFTRKVEIINSEDHDFRGALLGIENLEIPYEMLNFDIEKGDTLLLYSDGLNESINSEDEEYGDERIRLSFENAPDGSAENIMNYIINDLNKFVGNTPANDDLTIVALKKI